MCHYRSALSCPACAPTPLPSKFIEMADTVFMILSLKANQLSFLHVEHHAVMVPVMCVTCGRPEEMWYPSCATLPAAAPSRCCDPTTSPTRTRRYFVAVSCPGGQSYFAPSCNAFIVRAQSWGCCGCVTAAVAVAVAVAMEL